MKYSHLLQLPSLLLPLWNSVDFLSLSVLLQWTAAQTGQWTTWSTGCCRESRCGWSAPCSTVTSGPITARRRAWASVWCGTAAPAWATATSRSPSRSTAYAWARRKTPSGSGQPTFRMQGTTPASYGRTDQYRGGTYWHIYRQAGINDQHQFTWDFWSITFRPKLKYIWTLFYCTAKTQSA